ncbi:hypothetical protein ACIP5N_28100 [Streptomyces sp. NPDC088768]|uniref:hypothetical protein n=1 Tax=Streptomyces sp. NPDC088768 TaxID=3365894 RepID=UPI003813BAF2
MRDTEGRATVGTERPAKAAEDCTPHVLVVGATRVLRPSVRALVARGTAVTAVARDGRALAKLAAECGPLVRALAADAGAPGFARALRDAGGHGGFTGALVYTPALPAPRAKDLLRGTRVLILPSAWAAPDAARTAPEAAGPSGASAWTPDDLPAETAGSRRLVLGWHATPGASRWHTPAEISAAALALLDAPARTDAVLGEVRPWSARPA